MVGYSIASDLKSVASFKRSSGPPEPFGPLRCGMVYKPLEFADDSS